MGKQWKQWQTLFSWAPRSLQMVTTAMKLKDTCSLEEKLWSTETAYYKAETLLCEKRSVSQSYGFSSSHVWIWELDNKESWVLKNWCFRTVVLEKTLESPLDCKKNKPVNSKENWSWIFFGRTDAEAEAPILWLPDVKSRGTRDQIANIRWIMEKAREFQKNISFCFIDYAKAFDCVDHNQLWKILKDRNTRPPDLPLEKSVCGSGSNS